MHLFHHATPVLAVTVLLDLPHPVIQQRLIHKCRPLVQDRHLLLGQVLKPPSLVRMMCLFIITITDGLVQLDDTTNKPRRKHANRPKVQQVQPIIRPHLIVAHVRIAMDDPELVKRQVPRMKQRLRNAVLDLERRTLVDHSLQRPAFQPAHCQQPRSAIPLNSCRHSNQRVIGQHNLVQPHLRRLTQII